MRHTDVTRSSGSYTAARRAVPAVDRVIRVREEAQGEAKAGLVGRSAWWLFELLFATLERHKQRQALSALDDHLLKDIGISRAEAEQEVTKPFWRG
ncbi:DUF1127 domain-containing protein [Azospirillum picis]|uniref:Uncharacterized protein YjiS (DUF1127 family) n=1 Tax=Azospirillum picis TaxID=488438 RepID=A0ABU0MQP4_9PROT|nr:DUF1127 domain-containing protein [Azospirillum picis]MBP2302206.1 uncharacterized protein YjiS (DUF1127 family) [Azospirillum picis]MDQ0535785.1 uncharacterized protein YjiS (DUF1127 family) [Azospirillum picis]